MWLVAEKYVIMFLWSCMVRWGCQLSDLEWQVSVLNFLFTTLIDTSYMDVCMIGP